MKCTHFIQILLLIGFLLQALLTLWIWTWTLGFKQRLPLMQSTPFLPQNMIPAFVYGTKFQPLIPNRNSRPTTYPGYDYSIKHTTWGNGQRDLVAEFVQSCLSFLRAIG